MIELTVLGQKMAFKATGDEEVAREAAALAALKIKDAEKRITRGTAHQVAMVALLDLAEDYVRAKKRTLEYRKRMDDKATALVELVENELECSKPR